MRARRTIAATALLATLAPGLAPMDGAGAAWPVYRGDPALTGVAEGWVPDAPELLWTHGVGAAIASSPVVAAGTVYFGADDSRLHAVRLEDGEVRWTFQTGDMIEA